MKNKKKHEREALAKTITDEFNNFCRNTCCKDCTSVGCSYAGCIVRFVCENYDVMEKEE